MRLDVPLFATVEKTADQSWIAQEACMSYPFPHPPDKTDSFWAGPSANLNTFGITRSHCSLQ